MIKRRNMVESASGTSTLTLEAESNESFLLKELKLYNIGASADDHKIMISRKMVAHFKAPADWYLLGSLPASGIRSTLSELTHYGLGLDIPVGAGQKVEITAPGASNYMELVYDVYTPDEQTPDLPYGTESDRYKLYQVISNSTAVTAAGDVALDQSDIDSAFPAFPGGDVVPGGMEMRLHALFGGGYSRGDGSDNTLQSTYFRMIKDREDILDKDMNGIILLGDASYTTDGKTYVTDAGRLNVGAANLPPRVLVFDDPVVFKPGTELNCFMTVAENTDGDTAPAGDIKMGMVFEAIKV